VRFCLCRYNTVLDRRRAQCDDSEEINKGM
jgi:hypothetical protein